MTINVNFLKWISTYCSSSFKKNIYNIKTYHSLSDKCRRSSSSDIWSLDEMSILPDLDLSFVSPVFLCGLHKGGMAWLMSELSEQLFIDLIPLTNGITSLISLSWDETDSPIGWLWRLPFVRLLPEGFTGELEPLLAVTRLWKVGWLPVLLMGMFPWLHIFGGDCRMGEDTCEGLETVWEARRRTGDFGIAARGQK